MQALFYFSLFKENLNLKLIAYKNLFSICLKKCVPIPVLYSFNRKTRLKSKRSAFNIESNKFFMFITLDFFFHNESVIQLSLYTKIVYACNLFLWDYNNDWIFFHIHLFFSSLWPYQKLFIFEKAKLLHAVENYFSAFISHFIFVKKLTVKMTF